ncbi:MAG: nucleotidyltransferase domain-containing protein [Planctomycetes bacterium]|nr:nucleotidyltransferase domain-containing protein [Planctomycetota bacterium]
MVDRAILSVIRRYLAALKVHGIDAQRAVLFGSQARGQAHPLSDIDLVVIAPEFDGPRELALIKTLWRVIGQVDSRLEPIPCGLREWETQQGRPILEIARREGIEIAA